MKGAFREYYSPSDGDLQDLLHHAIIVVDTNVLLNLYRSSEKTSDELLKLLGAAKNQLWLPHQVGLEYHQNLDEVIAEVRSRHVGVDKVLVNAFNKLRIVFSEYRHPFIREYVLAKIDDLGEKLRAEFQKDHWHVDKLNERAERVRHAIEGLYSDASIGAPYSEADLSNIYKEGERRYRDQIPPGFKDAQKTGRRPYGDLIAWKQMIAKAKADASPLLFVTDDLKDDWWLSIKGEKKGPLPALRAEMHREAGQMYYAYTSDQFLRYGAPVFLERPVDSGALQDAQRATRADELRDSDLALEALMQNLRDHPVVPAGLTGISGLEALMQNLRDHPVLSAGLTGISGLEALMQNLRDHPVLPAGLTGISPGLEALMQNRLDLPGLTDLSPALEAAFKEENRTPRSRPPVGGSKADAAKKRPTSAPAKPPRAKNKPN
jgi:rRNA-processing protein FCF1